MPELNTAQPRIQPAQLRSVLGRFVTGVTLITAVDDGEPVGLAANSFTSVSLDPPLVAFCAGHSSDTWPRIQRAGAFAVNVLDEEQQVLCTAFAAKGADRYAGLDWQRGTMTGSPVIPGSLAWLECHIEAEHPAGDHTIVVGRVLDMGMGGSGRPLVFFGGGFGRLVP